MGATVRPPTSAISAISAISADDLPCYTWRNTPHSLCKNRAVGGTSMAHHSYVVTTTADAIGLGTLRSAILFADAHPGTIIT
jgi:hypothetical protein